MRVAVAVATLALLAACSDPGNRAPGVNAPQGKSWQAPENSGYVAPGWTSGDERSWDEQLRRRAQNQNEYTRVGS
jgi:hypothetical protein